MKKMLILSLSFVTLSQALIFAEQASDQVQSVAHNPQAALPVSWKEIKGKKIETPEMVLLSGLFELTPVGILRMDLVQKSAIKMLKEIESKRGAAGNLEEGKEYVQEQISQLLKPVEDFFTIARDYESIVKPLLAASLGVDCFILKAYETDGDICKFLESNVETVDKLEAACTELLQFFKDLKGSLGEGARKAYIDLRKQLKEKKQKK